MAVLSYNDFIIPSQSLPEAPVHVVVNSSYSKTEGLGLSDHVEHTRSHLQYTRILATFRYFSTCKLVLGHSCDNNMLHYVK
jgi:hypothetical protein